MSSDQKSWSSLPDTTDTRTSVTGLTVGAAYYFRVRALVIKAGLTNWSQVVWIVVL